MPALIRTEPGSPRKCHLSQQAWADNITTATTPTMNIRGKVVQVETKLVCADAAITATVAITTANGATLFSQASIPEGGKVYDSESNKGTPDANFNPFYVSGILTFTCTPSGNPGASGATLDVIVTII